MKGRFPGSSSKRGQTHPSLGQQRRVFWAPWRGVSRQGDVEGGAGGAEEARSYLLHSKLIP